MIVNPNSNTEGIPSGLIAMWSGATNNIPSGWVLCNGSNGAPDLRDRFIVGAGNTYSVGDSGGSNTVALTLKQMPNHNHEYTIKVHSTTFVGSERDIVIPNKSTSLQRIDVQSTSFSGEGKPHENRPPYYALCFIMKT